MKRRRCGQLLGPAGQEALELMEEAERREAYPPAFEEFYEVLAADAYEVLRDHLEEYDRIAWALEEQGETAAAAAVRGGGWQGSASPVRYRPEELASMALDGLVVCSRRAA